LGGKRCQNYVPFRSDRFPAQAPKILDFSRNLSGRAAPI
jgi:hypothetical protein